MLPPDTFDAKASMSALPLQFTQPAADFLERLAAELDVPPSRYDEAKSRYESVSAWLDRDASTLKQYSPLVYVQGSFRLGTPIRPANQDEHYDIDLVCELTVGKHQISQETLKELLGDEMRAYAKAHGMTEPAEGRRCWVLDYAKDAQFHLDALPAVPDAAGMRHQLAARAMTSPWAETAIAITDIHHPAYHHVDSNWPHSNPRGYTEWFRNRMKLAFQAKRNAMALTVQASVESIPSYRVKTPLQQVVQILKRHRDLMFIDDPDNKPISIIITTLAAHAYGNEATVAEAMSAILSGMAKHIRFSTDGRVIIANPTGPLENFADKWVEYPERRNAFFRWLLKAQEDFARILQQWTPEQLVASAKGSVGETFARGAAGRTNRPFTLTGLVPRMAAALSASHRQPAPWPVVKRGNVTLKQVTWTAKGFSRPISLRTDASPLIKNASLMFKAQTDVPAPYDVYWQVVNTGIEAAQARDLRGGFDAGATSLGSITRREMASYAGSHTIECFIVKSGYLVARSGQFVVNVR